MSYASRLVAMSSRTLAARPLGLAPHVEEERVDPPPALPTLPTPGVLARAPAPPAEQTILAPTPVVAPRTSAPTVEHRLAPAPVVVPPTEPREASPRAPVPFVAERETVRATPAPPAPIPDWLAERPDRVDPLEHLDASADLARLLRAAREWTSSAPAPIASSPALAISEPAPQAPVPLAAASPPAHAPQAQADSLEVSIGNIMITVEDAAAPPRRGRAERPAPSTVSSRLARHYIRGGG